MTEGESNTKLGKRYLSEAAIVTAVAEAAAHALTKKVIAELQEMNNCGLSGDDSGLGDIWEEICAQVQHEHSHSWDVYVETVKVSVEGNLLELPVHEQEALWLQTPEGQDWSDEDPDAQAPYPIVTQETANYLMEEYVLAAAGIWSSKNVSNYIDRASAPDDEE